MKKCAWAMLSREADLHAAQTEGGLLGIVFPVTEGFLGMLFGHVSAVILWHLFLFHLQYVAFKVVRRPDFWGRHNEYMLMAFKLPVNDIQIALDRIVPNSASWRIYLDRLHSD